MQLTKQERLDEFKQRMHAASVVKSGRYICKAQMARLQTTCMPDLKNFERLSISQMEELSVKAVNFAQWNRGALQNLGLTLCNDEMAYGGSTVCTETELLPPVITKIETVFTQDEDWV